MVLVYPDSCHPKPGACLWRPAQRLLFKLYYIWVGLYVASYVIVLVGLLGWNAIVGVAVLFVVANLIVAILRIVYLYRAWQDFNTRHEQLNQVSYDTFSEEKR